MSERLPLASRFRGFMPVVIDVECGGFNPNTDALLEIAAVLIELQPDGRLAPGESWRFHVAPFEGAKFEAASLAVTGIDPFHPLRPAIAEKEALTRLFKEVRRAMKENECTRAILVGHNAYFDLNFLNAAIELYAEAFEQAGALGRLQAFAAERGPDFYDLPRNREHITLERSPWTAPAAYPFDEDELVPFRAGESIAWRLAWEQRA